MLHRNTTHSKGITTKKKCHYTMHITKVLLNMIKVSLHLACNYVSYLDITKVGIENNATCTCN